MSDFKYYTYDEYMGNPSYRGNLNEDQQQYIIADLIVKRSKVINDNDVPDGQRYIMLNHWLGFNISRIQGRLIQLFALDISVVNFINIYKPSKEVQQKFIDTIKIEDADRIKYFYEDCYNQLTDDNHKLYFKMMFGSSL